MAGVFRIVNFILFGSCDSSGCCDDGCCSSSSNCGYNNNDCGFFDSCNFDNSFYGRGNCGPIGYVGQQYSLPLGGFNNHGGLGYF